MIWRGSNGVLTSWFLVVWCESIDRCCLSVPIRFAKAASSWRDWVDDEKRKGTSFVAIQISLSCWSTISPLVSHPNIKSSLSNIIWARGLISSWSTVSQFSGQKKMKNLTWNWDGIRTSCRGDRVENHATNTIDTDTRSTVLDDRVVGIGGTANGDPIGSASIANHTASCWGSAGDTERHRGCIDCKNSRFQYKSHIFSIEVYLCLYKLCIGFHKSSVLSWRIWSSRYWTTWDHWHRCNWN